MVNSTSFTFPEARLQPKQKDPPHAHVPWLTGLYGNVQFEEWTDFHTRSLVGSGILQRALSEVDNCDFTAVLQASQDRVKRTPMDGERDSRTVVPDCSSLFVFHSTMMKAIEVVTRRADGTRNLRITPKHILQQCSNRLPKTMSMNRTPEFTLMKPTDVAAPGAEPMVAFQLHGHCSNIIASGTTGLNEPGNPPDTAVRLQPKTSQQSRVSASELCARYNALFSRNPSDKQTEVDGPESCLVTDARLLVAQAVSSALSVRSGCAFLCNYHVGVALRVVRGTYDKVFVHLSRPYYRDIEHSPFLAMLALSVYGLSRVSRHPEAPAQLERLAAKVEENTRNAQEMAKDTVLGKKRSRKGDGPPEKRLKKTGSRVNSINCGKAALRVDEAHRLEPRVLLGSGNSGTVFLSTWNGKGVAIKQWNGNSREGLQCMVDEVLIIASMKKKCSALFGLIIPKVFLASKGAELTSTPKGVDGPIIVTEFVGEPVFRDPEGRLHFGDSRNAVTLNGIEERAIYEMARLGLNVLHRHGLSHGSVSLRNIRVSRTFADYPENRWIWRVWWIDFGRTSWVGCGTLPCFSEEREACRHMFRTRAPPIR